MSELGGKVAIVTGSSSGIGEATARRLAELGAHVVVNSASSVAAGEAVAESLPTEGLYVQADISNQAQGQALIDGAVERFGRIDILVNNAGWTTVVPHGDLDALTDDILMKTFEVNVFGTWWLTKAAMPHLTAGGRIITIGSAGAERIVGPSTVYSMTKSALQSLTRGLARELGPRDITVNLVQPGSTNTDMNPAEGEFSDFQRALIPLGRYGEPEDVAAAVAFLASNAARQITGTILTVDGGTLT